MKSKTLIIGTKGVCDRKQCGKMCLSLLDSKLIPINLPLQIIQTCTMPLCCVKDNKDKKISVILSNIYIKDQKAKYNADNTGKLVRINIRDETLIYTNISEHSSIHKYFRRWMKIISQVPIHYEKDYYIIYDSTKNTYSFYIAEPTVIEAPLVMEDI